MVFFNCNACGESVKKNQVEKHYQFKCRSCTVLSCVDCGKDFAGEAYKEHIKCMTEDAKYGGKNYKAKPNANKGERKQEAWTDQVQAAIDNVTDRSLKNLLESIKGYTNIPRKKNKFENFLKNSIRVQGNMPQRAWDAINAEISKNQPTPEANGTSENQANTNQSNGKESGSQDSQSEDSGSQAESEKKLSKREKKLERQKKGGKAEKKNKNKEDTETVSKKKSKRKRQEEEEDEEEEIVTEEEASKKKKKKRKNEEEEEAGPSKKKKKKGSVVVEEEEEEEEAEENGGQARGKFRWEDVIVSLLKKQDDKEMAVKKLRKKVLAAYHEHGSSKPETEESLLAKFNKKINKNKKLRVLKDKVKLL